MTFPLPHKRTLLLLLIAIIIPTTAGAQIIGLLTLERLSLLDPYGTGARPLAMGEAYTAVGGDVYSLLYNPAGLALMDKREVSLGFHHAGNDVDQNYDGIKASKSAASTSFGHAALAYPYEEYHNSLVFAMGVFRTSSSDLEYIRNGVRPDLGGIVGNTFTQNGSLYQYRFGAGASLSPSISVGAALVIWDETVQFKETIDYAGQGDSSYVYTDDGNADIDGISLDLGMLIRFGDYINAGLTISTPAKLDIDGDTEESYEGSFQDGSEWYTDPWYYYVDDGFTIPMRISAGLSFQNDLLLVSGSMTYSDYRQTKYNGLKLVNDNEPARDVLDDVMDLHIGAEVRIPGTDFSLRGGYVLMPLRFKSFDEMTYVVDTDEEFGLVTEYDFYEVKDDRQFFTFGIGGLVDEVLMIDVGVRIGSFERSSPYLTEKRTGTDVVASASYRF